MTTPFDPLFFALYYIRSHNVDKCQPIEQTIIDDDYSKAYLIADAMTAEQLALVNKNREKKIHQKRRDSNVCVCVCFCVSISDCRSERCGIVESIQIQRNQNIELANSEMQKASNGIETAKFSYRCQIIELC